MDGAGVDGRVVQPVEVEVLVLERVGELVDEGDLEADGHLRAAHSDALVGGVVERERAAVDHAVERLVEVELARRHAERAQLPGVVLEVGPLGLLRRPVVVLGGLRGVLGGVRKSTYTGWSNSWPRSSSTKAARSATRGSHSSGWLGPSSSDRRRHADEPGHEHHARSPRRAGPASAAAAAPRGIGGSDSHGSAARSDGPRSGRRGAARPTEAEAAAGGGSSRVIR